MPKSIKRTVVTKDGITTEHVPRTTTKKTILRKKGKKKVVLRNLRRVAKQKERVKKVSGIRSRATQRKNKKNRDGYRFRRIETLVHNKRNEMKHWKQTSRRRNDRKANIKLRERLKSIPILLIVRIHTDKNLPPQTREIFRKLGIGAGSCVILRNTPELQETLLNILPYVTFGKPSAQVVRELVTKRGWIHHPRHKRCAITSNMIVEESLGHVDCICLEDIIDVLSRGPGADGEDMKEDENWKKFDAVTKSVNPFHLQKKKIPIKGLQHPYDLKGYWGFRGSNINEFVERVL